MVNPGIHAEMTILIQREKELEQAIDELKDEQIPLWEKRVKLADQKGMPELADEAEQRVELLRGKLSEAQLELDSIDMKKDMLRKESRRPSGAEVERAEAMVESVRQAGLVDPDRTDWDELEKKAAAREAGLDEESGAVFDFDDDSE